MDSDTCYFACKAVADNSDVLERLNNIFDGLDQEFMPCCILDTDVPFGVHEEDGLYYLKYYGYIKGSFLHCVTTQDYVGVRKRIGFSIDQYGMWDVTKPVYSNAHYANLLEICDKLDLHMEVYTQDEPDTKVEHIFIDPEGEYSYETMEPKVVLNIRVDDEGAIEKLDQAFTFCTSEDIFRVDN